MKLIFIYVTFPSKKEAEKAAKILLGKKLIACANIFPISSIYRWQERVAKDREAVLIAKTIEKKFESAKKEIERMHPYKIPCIVKIPVLANKKYFNWAEREVGK